MRNKGNFPTDPDRGAILEAPARIRFSVSERRAIGRGVLTPAVACIVFALPACNPTVRLNTAVKPIAISLYVKIDQDVRMRVVTDPEAENLAALLLLSGATVDQTGSIQITPSPDATHADTSPRK